MSFGITPHFEALEIAFSQHREHHLQNILYYHRGKLRNYTQSSENSLELEELRNTITSKIRDTRNELEFPCLNQTQIARYVSGVLYRFLKKIEEDPVMFIDNITISDSTVLTSLNLTLDSIQREIERMMLQDEVLVLKLDVYTALPYESVFSEEKDSHHQNFLKKFQKDWGIVRPWRYTSVRHWIYIPRITIYGEEIYDLESTFRYTRDLGRYLITKDKIDCNYLRKGYSYLKMIKLLNDTNTYPTRFPDQVTIHQIRSPLRSEFDDILLKLETFFERGPLALVISLLCDMKLGERIQHTHPNINQEFFKQSHQTQEYLLQEHHITCDISHLETYIRTQLSEEDFSYFERVRDIVRFVDPN